MCIETYTSHMQVEYASYDLSIQFIACRVRNTTSLNSGRLLSIVYASRTMITERSPIYTSTYVANSQPRKTKQNKTKQKQN